MKNKNKIAALLAASTVLLNGCAKTNSFKKDKDIINNPIYVTQNVNKKSIEDIAWEVYRGYWGNGHERRDALTKAGYDYDTIMQRVNEIVKERNAQKEQVKQNQDDEIYEKLANEVIKGLWGNGHERKEAITNAGYDYERVRSIVNRKVKEKESIKENTSISVAYVNENTVLFDSSFNPIYNIDKYQKVFIFNDFNGDYAHICIPNVIDGFVYIPYLTELANTYVEVDISDQKLYMYKNNELVMVADVITGKNSHSTDLGYTEVIKKYDKVKLNGKYTDCFIQFNDSQEGFVNADGWRKNSDYNNKELYKKDGTNGSINMKEEDIELLDQYTSIGTKVLIHK